MKYLDRFMQGTCFSIGMIAGLMLLWLIIAGTLSLMNHP